MSIFLKIKDYNFPYNCMEKRETEGTGFIKTINVIFKHTVFFQIKQL